MSEDRREAVIAAAPDARRTWRMPRIPTEVTAVVNRYGWRYTRQGETRFWATEGGSQMTERDLIAGYDPIVEVRDGD
jgi:hypothetical protein